MDDMDNNSELLARIDERTERMEKALEKINGRLREVESTELTCRVRMADVPDRVRLLEVAYERQQGMATAVKILTGGSVIAFVTALISIAKVIGLF